MASDRSCLLLGIIRWIRADQSRLSHVIHVDLDSIVSEKSRALVDFLEIARALDPEVSPATLEKWGMESMNDGVALRVRPVMFAFSDQSAIATYPDFDMDTWNQAEATFPPALCKAKNQVKQFNHWEQNSCPQDPLRTLAQCLGLFVQQADQITFAQLRQLGEMQVGFRLLCEQPWNTLAWNPSRSALMSMYKELWRSNGSVGYDTVNVLADSNEGARETFAYTPSMSYTASETYVCCDGLRQWCAGGNGRQAVTRTAHELSLITESGEERADNAGKTLFQVFFETFFSTRTAQSPAADNPNRGGGEGWLRTPFQPCSRGAEACTQLYDTETVVLVRMPPILFVTLEGGSPLHHSHRCYFDDMRIPHLVLTPQAASDKRKDSAYTETITNATYRLRAITVWSSAHFSLVTENVPGHEPGVYVIDAANNGGLPQGFPSWDAALATYHPFKVRIVNLCYVIESRSQS